MIKDEITEILLSEQDIINICKRLGAEITKDYQGKTPILVGLLKGCLPFMADLMRYINTHVETYYMAISSYHGGIKSSGDVIIKYDLERSIAGRDVIILEDIVDTGQTITTVVNLLLHRGAKSVSVATLLDKPSGRVVEYKPKYVGKVIPKAFVVGYGLDYEELYRNVPYIGVLDPKVYTKE